MEFTAVILLLTLYYLRPQDWVPGLSGLNVVKPVMILGIIGLMTRRRRSPGDVKWPYMGTPHEWVIVVYAAYVLLTTPVFDFTAGDLLPKVLAFFLTLHSLTSEKRLDDFLRWWRWSLVAVRAPRPRPKKLRSLPASPRCWSPRATPMLTTSPSRWPR